MLCLRELIKCLFSFLDLMVVVYILFLKKKKKKNISPINLRERNREDEIILLFYNSQSVDVLQIKFK